MSRRTIYISGPIAGDKNAKARFAEVATRITDAGDEPINPFDVGNHCDPPCVPRAGAAHEWSCHLRWDLAEMLGRAQGIYMLRGWEKSHGARLEHLVAAAVGIPITYEPAPAEDSGATP